MLNSTGIPKETIDFFDDIETYNIKHEFKELQTSRGRITYERILKTLENIKLPDPLSLSFSTYSLKELKDLLTEILCKIFGSEYNPQIEEYNKLVVLEKIDNPFDAILESKLESTLKFQVPKKIYISDKCESIQIVSLGHEYIHAFLSKYSTELYNSVLNNIHYKELLPIIVEYIICYELSTLLKSENLIYKHELYRLNHDKNQVTERNSCVKLSQMIRKEFKGQIINNLPIMKYIEYQEHNAFTYIIADIYAQYLSNIYQTSPRELINIIKGIFVSDNCINDLITYFNLFLTNTEIIDNYNKKIKSLSL